VSVKALNAMKNIDRLSLIDRIGRELQSRMSYSDISTYLRGFGVNTSKEISGVNSKWVYTKELLSDTPGDTILRIADELNIPHGYIIGPARETFESSFWAVNHFRLFVSHLSTFKREAGLLQGILRRYGISAFVAHVDIEPTKEWQDEIEAALNSMDALVAILMPGFHESNWTDQEVGFAIGRGALVIPVMRGLTPYGLMGKFQGLNSHGKNVGQVAREVFDVIAESPKTRARMLSCLVETTLQSGSEEDGLDKLGIMASISDLPVAYLEKLREGVLDSRLFRESESLLRRTNDLFTSRGLAKIARPEGSLSEKSVDEDIPF
jgi:hypothetical protein